jgi:hypothetical protein
MRTTLGFLLASTLAWSVHGGEAQPDSALETAIARMAKGIQYEKNSAAILAKGKEAVPALLRHARTDNNHKRAMCAIHLGKIGGRHATEALLVLLKEGEELGSVLPAIAEAGHSAALPALRAYAKRDVSPFKREWTSLALGACGDKNAIPELVRLLRDDRMPRQRKKANELLKKIAGVDFREDSRAAAAWYARKTGKKVDVSTALPFKREADDEVSDEIPAKFDIVKVKALLNDYWLSFSFTTRGTPDATLARCSLVVTARSGKGKYAKVYVIRQSPLKRFTRPIITDGLMSSKDCRILPASGKCLAAYRGSKTSIVMLSRDDGLERIPLESTFRFQLLDSEDKVLDEAIIESGKPERMVKRTPKLPAMPKADHAWSSNEYRQAATAVVALFRTTPDKLPRHDSAVFKRLCLDGGIGEVGDKRLSESIRSQCAVRYYRGLSIVLMAYFKVSEKGLKYDHEMAELMVCSFRLSVATARLTRRGAEGSTGKLREAYETAKKQFRAGFLQQLEGLLASIPADLTKTQKGRLSMVQGITAGMPEVRRYLKAEDLNALKAMVKKIAQAEKSAEVRKALANLKTAIAGGE